MAGSRMGVVQHNQRGKLAGIRRRNVQGQPLFAALHGVRNRTSQLVSRRSATIHRRQKAGVRPLAGLRFNLGQVAAPHRQDVRVSFRPLSGGYACGRTADPNRRSPIYRYRNRRLHPSSADGGDAAQGARSGAAGPSRKTPGRPAQPHRFRPDTRRFLPAPDRPANRSAGRTHQPNRHLQTQHDRRRAFPTAGLPARGTVADDAQQAAGAAARIVERSPADYPEMAAGRRKQRQFYLEVGQTADGERHLGRQTDGRNHRPPQGADDYRRDLYT